jgi:predicted DNA-binding transcriptional regulator AlpA
MANSTSSVRPARGDCSSLPLLIDAPLVAEMTRRSVRSVWRDHAAGRLPRPVRIGGAVRWRREEIIMWVAAGCPSRDEWEATEGRRHDPAGHADPRKTLPVDNRRRETRS